MRTRVYWAVAVALILFGALAIFSIGAPFLFLGLMLAALFPWRERRGVLASGIATVLGFVLGYVLVAPLSCSGTESATVGGSMSDATVTCRNLLGIRFEGGGNYEPSLLPALLAGIASALAAGFTTMWLARSRSPVDVPS